MGYSQNLYSIVKNILGREGQSATLVQQPKGTQGTYDVETGVFTGSAPVSTTVKVVVLDYALITNGKVVSNNTLIESNDKECYMDAKSSLGVDLASKPSPTGDTLVINGETWRIMNVKEVNPSGSYTVMYNLLLRK